MYMLNGWWFLSSSGSYRPVFMVVLCYIGITKMDEKPSVWLNSVSMPLLSGQGFEFKVQTFFGHSTCNFEFHP